MLGVDDLIVIVVDFENVSIEELMIFYVQIVDRCIKVYGIVNMILCN